LPGTVIEPGIIPGHIVALVELPIASHNGELQRIGNMRMGLGQPFDAPIVRKVHAKPRGVLVLRLFGSLHLTCMKSPAAIERLGFPGDD
jgi:hypothetical protein